MSNPLQVNAAETQVSARQ